MTKVLIIGAGGGIAQIVTDMLLNDGSVNPTLFLRKPGRLKNNVAEYARVIEGDVMQDQAALKEAMTGQDLVYINLAGDLEKMNIKIVAAMKEANVENVIFISSIGIYQTPLKSVLVPYRKGADVIEASGLNYTILRPEWFSNDPGLSYETTLKGSPEKGGTIGRKALATLITEIIKTPDQYRNQNLGVNTPLKN